MSFPKFKNEPYTDWSKPSNRKKHEQAIAGLESELGKEYRKIIGGQIYSQERFLLCY